MKTEGGNRVPDRRELESKVSLPETYSLWWPNMEESRAILADFDQGTEAIPGDENPEFLPDDPDPGDEE